MSRHIYISYSDQDIVFVRELVKQLNFTVWYREQDLIPGDSRGESVGNALRNSWSVIMVLSCNYMDSDWGYLECDITLERRKSGKKIIPILLQDCIIPEMLSSFEPADFRGAFQVGLDSLLKALNKSKSDEERRNNNYFKKIDTLFPEIQSYLIRFIVYTLNQDKSSNKDLLRKLDIDNQTLQLLLGGGRNDKHIKVLPPLPKLTVEHGIFRSNEDAANFLSVSKGTIEELESKLSLLIISNKAGNDLSRLLKDFINRLRMTNDWKIKIVKPHLEKLRASGSNISLSVMRDIYFEAGILWSKSQMGLFVKSDFENKLWVNIIDNPQDLVEDENKTHLHHANEFLGKILSNLFVRERRKDLNNNFVRHHFKILEGGVGGANTTHQVMKRIIEKCEKEKPFRTIKYKGFEINEAFAAQANQILLGEYNKNNDPRSNYFLSLNKNSNKFSPIEGQFIDDIDMSYGINKLVLDRESQQNGDIDLFISSYAFHHVPNGRDLKAFIFGFGDHSLSRLDLLSAPGKEFIKEVKFALNASLQVGFNYSSLIKSFKSPYARSLIEFIQLDTLHKFIIKDLLIDFGRLVDSRSKIERLGENSSWIRAMFDFQLALLKNVYSLLRVGGYVAIADPDGYSNFNKQNLPENAEMGVAHFLNRQQLVELLEGAKFTVIDKWTQVKTDSSNTFEAIYGHDDKPIIYLPNEGVKDSNLGYMVIAQKQI